MHINLGRNCITCFIGPFSIYDIKVYLQYVPMMTYHQGALFDRNECDNGVCKILCSRDQNSAMLTVLLM